MENPSLLYSQHRYLLGAILLGRDLCPLPSHGPSSSEFHPSCTKLLSAVPKWGIQPASMPDAWCSMLEHSTIGTQHSTSECSMLNAADTATLWTHHCSVTLPILLILDPWHLTLDTWCHWHCNLANWATELITIPSPRPSSWQLMLEH
jgi:hypothetical protein